MRSSIVIFVVALMFLSFTKPGNEASGIKWLTWQEAQEAQKKQPRKIFVDTYTDWCSWCKRMDAVTFSNPEIINYINQNFYAVKFNAETRETIKFKGRDYNFVSQGARGYNELANEILNGQLSYPTTVYFDESLNQLFPVPGFLDAKTFETVLHFVATNAYQKGTWEDFQAKFKGKIQ